MSNAELAAHAFGIRERWFLPWIGDHTFLIYAASIPVGGLAALTAAIGVPELLTPLLGGLGEVDSAAPSTAMWQLGRQAYESPALAAFFDAGVRGLDHRLRQCDDASVVAFIETFDQFLFEYGSRGVNEWELNTPIWQTHPDIALGAIDRMRLSDAGRAPGRNLVRMVTDHAAAVATIRDMLAGDPATLGQFDALLHAAEIFLPARERSKTSVVRMVGEVKVALREVGLRLTRDGHLNRPEDFAMVTRQEFDDFVVNPAGYTERIRARRAHLDALAALEPPFIVVGDPPAPSTWARRDAAIHLAAKEGTVIQGVSACAGVVTGVAHVIHDPGDVGDLQPGEILVAPRTDPSWTPLFDSAAAVVVDVGAVMSHAAIVSRELGIPCVMSCMNASETIATGTTITVDGAAGTVLIGADAT